MATEVTVDNKYVFTIPDGDYRVHITRYASPWLVVSEGSKAIGALMDAFHEQHETLRSFTMPRSAFEEYATGYSRGPSWLSAFTKLEYLCRMPSQATGAHHLPHSAEDKYRFDHPDSADEHGGTDGELYTASDLDDRGSHPYALTYGDLRAIFATLKKVHETTGG